MSRDAKQTVNGHINSVNSIKLSTITHISHRQTKFNQLI